MHPNARVPSLARMGLRLHGRPSVDPRDVGARLDRALHTASRDSDGRAPRRASPVQVVGTAHRDPGTYRSWREHQLRRAAGGFFPELADGEWACVLSAMDPAELQAFTLGAARGGLGPPLVGRFAGDVTLDVGLAATLIAWLAGRHAIVLAPPLLGEPDRPHRLATLRRGWPLRPAELPALDGGPQQTRVA